MKHFSFFKVTLAENHELKLLHVSRFLANANREYVHSLSRVLRSKVLAKNAVNEDVIDRFELTSATSYSLQKSMKEFREAANTQKRLRFAQDNPFAKSPPTQQDLDSYDVSNALQAAQLRSKIRVHVHFIIKPKQKFNLSRCTLTDIERVQVFDEGFNQHGIKAFSVLTKR